MSPSRRADVRIDATSEPASGSVSPKHASFSPFACGVSQRFLHHRLDQAQRFAQLLLGDLAMRDLDVADHDARSATWASRVDQVPAAPRIGRAGRGGPGVLDDALSIAAVTRPDQRLQAFQQAARIGLAGATSIASADAAADACSHTARSQSRSATARVAIVHTTMTSRRQFIMTIVPVDKLYVDANFRESQLRRVRIGMPVTLTSDLYGGDVVYHGKITGFAGGTGSSMAVIPAQNATGNWIKTVQRLPVRIELDPAELRKHPLRVGLSMEVEIDVSRR